MRGRPSLFALQSRLGGLALHAYGQAAIDLVVGDSYLALGSACVCVYYFVCVSTSAGEPVAVPREGLKIMQKHQDHIREACVCVWQVR